MSDTGTNDGRQVALVTGAARGQGRAHARMLAATGHDLILLDACAKVAPTTYPPATTEELAETARACEDEGARVVSDVVDLRDGVALRAILDRAVAELGRLDVVVANAGVSYFVPFLDLSDDDWDAMITNNLTSAQRTVSAAAPHMVRAGNGGSIILTASVGGLKVIPFETHYVASKHGLIGMMKCLAVELAPHGIRVNAIAPGGVQTAMAEGTDLHAIFGNEERATMFAGSFNPLMAPGMSTPDEIADVVKFLCSPAAKAITGHVLPIDYGVTAR